MSTKFAKISDQRNLFLQKVLKLKNFIFFSFLQLLYKKLLYINGLLGKAKKKSGIECIFLRSSAKVYITKSSKFCNLRKFLSAKCKSFSVWPNHKNLCLWNFLPLKCKVNANNTIESKKNNELKNNLKKEFPATFNRIFIIENFIIQ